MSLVAKRLCGHWKIFLIRAGQIKMDGGAIFGVVPKPLWEQRLQADARNRVTLAMNCLVAQNDKECILIETGFGGKVTQKQKEFYDLEEEGGLLASLAEIGIGKEEVTRVVVTHLHQDHAGGCTVQGVDGYEPTFTNATYYVQQGEWMDAEQADGQTANGYRLQEVMIPLKNKKSVVLLNGDVEICSGLRVMVTPGHTRCHQSVLVDTGEGIFCYIGDLIPTTHHLRPIYILAYDLYPRETFLHKQALMNRAYLEKWTLVWSHDKEIPWGMLDQDNQGNYFPI